MVFTIGAQAYSERHIPSIPKRFLGNAVAGVT
jgi:hypothetical protein